jgi:hypothetical protein
MLYCIVVPAYGFQGFSKLEAHLKHKMELKHTAVDSSYVSIPLAMKDAQKIRDACIKEGLNGSQIRIEYYRK